jgi:MYXO-CTERM domain-containing protein
VPTNTPATIPSLVGLGLALGAFARRRRNASRQRSA